MFAECKKGYKRDADSDDCAKCPTGTYSDTLGAASCTSCPEGQTTGHDGADDISSCRKKNYWPSIILGIWGKYCNENKY